MILDTNLQLANALAVSAAAGTAAVPNVIDLGTAVKNLIHGEQLYAVITVTTAFTSAGLPSVDFRIACDAQDPLATNGSATVVGSTGALGLSDLALGSRYIIPLHQARPGVAAERYLGLLVVTAIATTTAGSITVDITSTVPEYWVAHTDAVN